MDWNLAIEKNTQALAQIVAGLFVLVGWNETETQKSNQSSLRGRASLARERGVGRERTQAGGVAENKSSKDNASSSKPSITLGPITRRHLISVLRTAEAALRRLIVLYVRVKGVKVSAKTEHKRPLPDFTSFSSSSSNRPPIFNLFDPRKRLEFIDEIHPTLRHPGCIVQQPVPGFNREDPFEATLAHLAAAAKHSGSRLAVAAGMTMESEQTLVPLPNPMNLPPSVAEQTLRGSAVQLANGRWGGCPDEDKQSEQETKSSQKLLSRLLALDHALKTIPKQARRLVRTMAHRKEAPAGIKRTPPIRPGIPPGYAQASKAPEHEILRECHGMMRDWESGFL